MPKKPKSKKSKSKKAKFEAPDSKTSDEAVLARSIDDMCNLLKAVNEETLPRMERQFKDVNEITLKRMEEAKRDFAIHMNSVMNVMENRILPEYMRAQEMLRAIKAKTDRLP